jgi:hypothetical protein
MVELYLHSTMRVYGEVLNSLSSRKTLPLYICFTVDTTSLLYLLSEINERRNEIRGYVNIMLLCHVPITKETDPVYDGTSSRLTRCG